MLGMSLNTIGALALSQLAFMCLFFALNHRGQLIGRLVALYSFCFAAHVLSISIASESHPIVVFLLNRVATLAPAALWLLAVYLFVDNPRVPKSIVGLIVFYVILRGIGSAIGTGNTPALEAVYVVGHIVPQLIMMGFCFHAVYLAIQDLGNDLVESRRRVRVPFVIAMGLLVVAILIRGFIVAFGHYAEFLSFSIAPMPNELLFFYMFLITTAFNISCMRLRSDALQVINIAPEQQSRHLKPVPNTSIKNDSPALVTRIYDVLKEEKLYTRPGLTIGELAKRLSLQEYRLRRLINKQLGYRNFNQFLNELRIDEACRRLAEPSDHREQIANIAYDVGYSALSSFNKAFKDLRLVTPTQYRDNAQQGTNEEARRQAN